MSERKREREERERDRETGESDRRGRRERGVEVGWVGGWRQGSVASRLWPMA